ncbi:TATA-binding protein-associated phosphoprotein [Entamoeba marina]
MNNNKPPRESLKGEIIQNPAKDNELLQETFLLYLLNPFCTFVISKPTNRTNTLPYIFTIHRIQYESQDLDFEGAVEEIVQYLYEENIRKGLTKEKAKELNEMNRVSATINLLMDICLKFKYYFTVKKSTKQTQTLSIDKVYCVYYTDFLYITHASVKSTSQHILKYIYLLFEINQKIRLPQHCLQHTENFVVRFRPQFMPRD